MKKNNICIIISKLRHIMHSVIKCSSHISNYNSDNSLICISVNLGFTDQVMHVARQAGARGGTVIKARVAGGTTPEETLGVELNQEKELVLILAPKKDAADIMTAVNKEFGLRSKAQALIHAMPVEHAMKI